jgi:polar amino acid transport system substrate-binding protein
MKWATFFKVALINAFVVTLTMLASHGLAAAQSIENLVSAKTIKVGVLVDFPPFGLMNSDQKPDGFDVELANKMAAALGVQAEIVPVSNANRIPYLQSGRIDVLVASLGITPERAKQVMFTTPYAATSVIIAGSKSVQVKTLDDLANKKIAIGRGSASDVFFTKFVPQGATIMKFDGEAAAFQAALTGQADLFSTSNITVASLLRANPSADVEQKLTLSTQANGMAVRLDAFELHQWLNTFIYSVKANGELDALYKKWVKAPLPTLPQL